LPDDAPEIVPGWIISHRDVPPTVVLLVVVNVLYIASGAYDPDSLLYRSEPSLRVPVGVSHPR
jgi:hypothetical protein